MNHTFRILTVLGMAGCLGLVACSKEPATPQPTVKDTERPETRSIEAADAVGYNGKAIRQKLDKSLDANDAAKQKIDQAVDQ